jgi:hypothetical protein
VGRVRRPPLAHLLVVLWQLSKHVSLGGTSLVGLCARTGHKRPAADDEPWRWDGPQVSFIGCRPYRDVMVLLLLVEYTSLDAK